jgi:hypothetical protein
MVQWYKTKIEEQTMTFPVFDSVAKRSPQRPGSSSLTLPSLSRSRFSLVLCSLLGRSVVLARYSPKNP